MYDIYYTTGGGPWVNAGTDMWVNMWMELVAPKLDVKPILLLHRNKPKGHEDYEFPIEAYWHGDDIQKFEELCNGARRINILHGHYTPVKPILDNKDKIHSNVLHNSVTHILQSQLATDANFGWHPYLDSSWEQEVMEWSDYNIWVGLYNLNKKTIDIPNFYEFKVNRDLSDYNKIGFASRCEGRKNPHYLEGLESYFFTNSVEFNSVWKNAAKYDFSKSKIFHFNSDFKDSFYDMDWGISHSSFSYEPFGYSIFEAVDYGKLPILNTYWCKDFEYPYRASNKQEFKDIYQRILEETYETKLNWFNSLKSYLNKNFSNKEKWINELLYIYNI